MEPVTESLVKTWDKQKTLLSRDDEVPFGSRGGFAAKTHFKATVDTLNRKAPLTSPI